MHKEDKDRIKAKLRAEIQARLLEDLDEKVERAFAKWEAAEATRISDAVAATLGTRKASSKSKAKQPKPTSTDRKGCSRCGYEGGRARGQWSKPHTREEHRAAIEA